MKCSNRMFITGIIVICLCKLTLIAALRIIAIPGHMEDDGLYVSLAVNILNGEWLGPYYQATLAKGPFFPLFLAANFLLGLPLLFTEHLLYLISGIVLLYALSRTIKNQYLLLLIFIIYAFNPVTASASSLRIIREGIYPSLTVLVFAGMIGIASSADKSMKHIVMWSLLAGMSLSAFWLTREEGVWIIPSVFILLILNGWHVYHRGEKGLLYSRFFIAVFLPIIICVLGISLVATINKIKYDIFTINEMKHDAFTSAYGALLRIKHSESEPIIVPPEAKPLISVPRSVRDAVSRVSPAFRDINFNKVGDIWVGNACRYTKEPCDDIPGGLFVWALRQSVQQAGYYSDSKKAADYYRKLANEVNSACDKKLLQCGPKRSSLMPPLRREHLEKIPSTFIQGIKLISTFADTRAQLYPSPPTSPEALELIRNITRCIISPPSVKQVTVRGWVFRPGDEAVDVKIISDSNDVTIERLEGKDVVKHFNDNSARNSRFQINATYHYTCKLVFSIKERPLAESILNERPLSFKIHDMKTLFFIDSSSEININPLAQLDYVTFFRINILNRIEDIYSKYFRYFGIISLICYFYTLYLLIRRKVTSLFLINSSILLAIIARLLLISLIHVTSFPAVNVLYLSPVYPIMLIFMCLTIIDIALHFVKRYQGTIST